LSLLQTASADKVDMNIRFAAVVIALSFVADAQEAQYRSSVAAVVAANVADAGTSWGAREANPLLGRTFDGRAAAVKAGVTGAMLMFERTAIRRGYATRRKCTWINWAISGGLGLVAYRNSRLR
jgi:hypothetical protein